MGVTHCCFSRDEPDTDDLPQAFVVAHPQGWNESSPRTPRTYTPRPGPSASCACSDFRRGGSCRHLPSGGGGLPRTPRVAKSTDDEVLRRPVVIDPARIAYYMDSEKQVKARSPRSCGLFLDVDGVMHPYGFFGKDAFCHMPMLLRILDATKCDVVLSSSWRMDAEGLQEVNNRLVDGRPGVENAEVLDITERTRGSINRVGNRDIEIMAWVRDHAKEAGWDNRWIALDDLDLTQALGKEHAVVTVCEVGLTEEKVAEAIHKLMSLVEERPIL